MKNLFRCDGCGRDFDTKYDCEEHERDCCKYRICILCVSQTGYWEWDWEYANEERIYSNYLPLGVLLVTKAQDDARNYSFRYRLVVESGEVTVEEQKAQLLFEAAADLAKEIDFKTAILKSWQKLLNQKQKKEVKK